MEIIGRKTFKHTKCLNNERRKELGWRSAFEKYYGRKSNELLQCGKSIEKDRKPIFQLCLHLSSEIISDNERKTLRAIEALKKRNKEVSNRTVKYFRQRNKCLKYLARETIILKSGKKGKRVSKKYYVVLGKITKIGKHGDDCKVIFKNSETKAETTEWFLLNIWLILTH